MIHRTVILVCLLALSTFPVLAQSSHNSERPSPGARPTSRPTAPVTPSIGQTGPTAARTVPSFGRATSRTIPGTSGSDFGSSQPVVVPTQTYGWGSFIDYDGWYRCNMFLNRLYGLYSFLPIDDYLWRYAQGDSALTPESVRFALRDSVTASGSLQQLGQDMDDLIDAYARGDVSREEFSEQLSETTKEIRKSAKKIRKDRFLEYLDQGTSRDVPDYAQARSLEQLRSLSAALQQTSEQIGDTLTDYLERDRTRVVSIEELQSVSTESLSKQVDRMAKAIEKSGRSL